MKRFPFLLSLILCLLPTLAQCSAVGPLASKKPTCCSSNVLPVAITSDRSLWQLDSKWTNDFHQPVQLNTLAGRVQVVVMFFASCEYACPQLVHQMKQIEAKLPEKSRRNIGFTLVSFDPERDSPAALNDYRQRHALGTNNWTLLNGNSEDVLELAALLGIKYKKDARGQFTHSNVITVLNQKGEIVYQQLGLNQKAEDTLQAIERVTEKAE